MSHQKHYLVFSGLVFMFLIMSCAKAPANLPEGKMHQNRVEQKQEELQRQIEELKLQIKLMEAKLALVEIPSKQEKVYEQLEVAKVEDDEKSPIKIEAPVQSGFLGVGQIDRTNSKIVLSNQNLKNQQKIKVGKSKFKDDAEELYTKAFQMFESKKYGESIEMMQMFIRKYPEHSYADNAFFWIGESNFRQQHYDVALGYFYEVEKKYPKGNKVPDALLKIGASYRELGKMGHAKSAFEKTVKKY
ncbi:MAG: tol-pal system protein YbgF, partial [Bdellovibrionales bacterium]|nr:tol-pal system protein YbgF [Bdellovibrionales bacterium]